MKTIKFRIYNLKEKRMVESGATPMMLQSFFENTAVLHTRDEMEYQQFTGLSDKSGKEIYEGDIVKHEDYSNGAALNFEQPTSIHAIEWHKKYSGYQLKGMGYGVDGAKCEVIGNIYEKELLNENT